MSNQEKDGQLAVEMEGIAISEGQTSPISYQASPGPIPSAKITVDVHVSHRDQASKKSVRVQPSASMHDFIDKLGKKKVLPSSGSVFSSGSTTVKSEQLSISCGRSKENTVEIPHERWAEPVWNLGLRDKDTVLISIAQEGEEMGHSRRKSSGDDGKHSSSFMNRFTRKSIKPELPVEEVNQGLLFGVPLEEVADKGVPLMASPGVPAFIEESLLFIHTETEGVFRLSGSLTAIKALKKQIDAAVAPPFPEDVDVHCLTGLIKMYLRELPEPLLTFKLYDCWRGVAECEIKEKKLELIKFLLLALPKANYNLLKRLVEFFSEMVQFEATTKMGLVNMSTLIGPNLIWSPEKENNDISTPMKVSWFLLGNYSELFEGRGCQKTVLQAVGRAQYDFTAEEDGEINLKAGDIVFITEGDEDESGWLEGTPAKGIEHGKFPTKYFDLIEEFNGSATIRKNHRSQRVVLPPESSSDTEYTANPFTTDDHADDRAVDDNDDDLAHLNLMGLKDSIDGIKKTMAEETIARERLEQQVETLQANFHDMIQIVITLKNRIKELGNLVEEITGDLEVEPSPDGNNEQNE